MTTAPPIPPYRPMALATTSPSQYAMSATLVAHTTPPTAFHRRKRHHSMPAMPATSAPIPRRPGRKRALSPMMAAAAATTITKGQRQESLGREHAGGRNECRFPRRRHASGLKHDGEEHRRETISRDE